MKKLISLLIVLLITSVSFGQFYPFNPFPNHRIQTNVSSVNIDQDFIAQFSVTAANAVAASTTGVHAAVTDTGGAQTITTAITSPAVPRNVTATAGGTATDIKAIQVIVTGKDYANATIIDTLTAFTENTAATIQGTKAFKTVTSIYIPAHDGTGATTSIGWGNKLGLPVKLAHNTVLFAFLNNTKEGTAPTVAVNSSVLSKNTVTLNSALNGSKVDVYFIY